MHCVSWDSYLNVPYHKLTTVPGVLLSKFTMGEVNVLCDANAKMYFCLQIIHYNTSVLKSHHNVDATQN